MSEQAIIDQAAAGGEGGVCVVQRSRKEFSKPTQAELDERIALSRELLLQGKKDGQVKREVAERFGLAPRTVERYLRRARDLMISELKHPRAFYRAVNLSQYWKIINDESTPTRDRIKALERIDKLLGLEIHDSSSTRKIEISGPGGKPIESVSMSVDLGSKLGEFANAVRAAAISNCLESHTEKPASLPAPTIQAIESIPITVDDRQQSGDGESK